MLNFSTTEEVDTSNSTSSMTGAHFLELNLMEELNQSSCLYLQKSISVIIGNQEKIVRTTKWMVFINRKIGVKIIIMQRIKILMKWKANTF